MPRPKKIKSPEDFGKEFEKLKKPRKKEDELKKIIPAYSPVGGGITIFGDRETTEKVVAKLETDEQFDKIYNEVTDENVGKSPLEELQELEKKLRLCTTETPRDIKYEFSWETCLHIEYNNINVSASIAEKGRMVIGDKKGFRITAKKPYLATAQKMLEVLKEWREE